MSRSIGTRLAARAALAGAMLLAAVAAASAATLALTGGTVHTITAGDLENATVLVKDGKIVAVGASVNVPSDATVVDCAGKQVYPGMVSANTTLGLTEISSVLGSEDTEETGTTNPNIRAEVEFNPDSDLLPVTRINGITSALSVPQGGSITGTSALMHLSGWTWEDMTVKAPVGLHVRWPNMTPNRAWWETRSDEQQASARDSAIKIITAAFDDARAYWKARGAEGEKAVPRHDRDVKWDALGRVLRGEIPVIIEATEVNQIRAALKFVDDQQLKKVILISGSDAALVAGELKTRDIPVIVDAVLRMPNRRWENYDDASTAPERLRAAGVRFCISDGGGSWNDRNLPYNASMAAAFGLPRDEAVKSITLYPAQILGVGDQLGSIEPGKRADLVVTNGDLLEIPTQVEKVFIDGVATSMETRQTRLFEKYNHRPHLAAATAAKASAAKPAAPAKATTPAKSAKPAPKKTK
jgi:imidazolonepropionase-like amidohydrolase